MKTSLDSSDSAALEQFLDRTRLALFNGTAPRYNSSILPAFGPLAKSLVRMGKVQPGERVLDLGTGTGAAALAAGEMGARVAGVDYAAAMMPQARQNLAGRAAGDQVTLYQGDMSRLPHAAGSFDVAFSSFSFNGVEPGRVFPEVGRVLRPGGRLIFQEWGEIDPASKLVKQRFKAHQVEQAEEFLADLRRLGQFPRAWDELGGADGIAAALRRAGFRDIEIVFTQEAIRLEPERFFRFRTAWTPYQAELEAMTAVERAAVETEIVAQLRAWAEADGYFIWRPELLRGVAFAEFELGVGV